MSKKALLARFIDQPLIRTLAGKVTRIDTLRILGYHRVCDINENDYPFDEEIISASIKDFEKQMGFVARNFKVMTFLEVDELVRRNLPLWDMPNP